MINRRKAPRTLQDAYDRAIAQKIDRYRICRELGLDHDDALERIFRDSLFGPILRDRVLMGVEVVRQQFEGSST